MAIYKYTLKKYLSAWSTWIIIAVTALLVVILGGVVPFEFTPIKKAEDYAVLSVVLVASITSFLSIFSSVFAGFKGAQMFKDEVEDGTFLVMLSKPISRSKIIFFKWLALQSILIIYSIIIGLTFLVTLLGFDSTVTVQGLADLGIKTLSSNAFIVSAILCGITMLVSLIFSSIALLLSTKLSVGTTIGISIALGVVIPITSLIGTFTSKVPYKTVGKSDPSMVSSIFNSRVMSEVETNKDLKGMIDLIKQVDPSADLKTVFPDLTTNKETLYNIGVPTGDKDSFMGGMFFDVDYQLRKLSEFASEQVIPSIVRDQSDFSQSFGSGMITTSKEVDSSLQEKASDKQVDAFNEMIKKSWSVTDGYRRGLLAYSLYWLANSEFKTDLGNVEIKTNKTLHDIFGGNYIEKANGNIQLTALHDTVNAIFGDLVKGGSSIGTPVDNPYDSSLDIKVRIQNWLTYLFMSPAQLEKLPQTQWANYADALSAASYLTSTLHFDVDKLKQSDASIIKTGKFDIVTLNKDGSENYDMFVKVLDYTNSLLSPLDFWVSQKNAALARESIGYKYDQRISDEVTKVGYLSAWIEQSEWDKKDYAEMLSAINSGHYLAKIKTVEYANKNIILWAYLGIALALVPLAYFVIRRQDYR